LAATGRQDGDEALSLAVAGAKIGSLQDYRGLVPRVGKLIIWGRILPVQVYTRVGALGHLRQFAKVAEEYAVSANALSTALTFGTIAHRLGLVGLLGYAAHLMPQ